jgi:membrane protein
MRASNARRITAWGITGRIDGCGAMARSPLHPLELFALFKQSVNAWLEDYAPSMGAALSYYTLFSIAPLLLIVIGVAGLFFGEEAARGEIMGQLAGLVGPDGARAIEDLLVAVHLEDRNPWATGLSILALVVGATTVFGELQNALNRIWRGTQIKPRGLAGVWQLVRNRLLSLGIILCLGFLSMVSLVFNAVLSALSGWWTPLLGGDAAVLAKAADFIVSFGLITVMFAMLYKWVPYNKVHWREVWMGAVLTSLLFTLGKAGIGYYIGQSNVASAFGAAASLVVVMVWVYYSAQIFLLGAEITWVYSQRYRPPEAAAATPASR